jgi:hypothetical protein
VVLAQLSLAVRGEPLEQSDGVASRVGEEEGAGGVVAGGEGVGVVFAEDVCAVGEGLLEQGDRAGEVSC